MNEIYSDWFNVDLHIHTDYSNKTKRGDYEGEFDINILKSKLIENDVKLFSLTDHNIINVPIYEEYYTNYNEGDPVLLLGCEFDIRVEQDNKSFLTYHTLLIYDINDINTVQEVSAKIEQHFNDKGISDNERSLDVDEIFELFHEYHFFYIPHAGGHKNIIDAYKGTDIKKAQEMVLLMECAHEKVKEHHRIRHREGFDKLKEPEFRERKDEAFINFSDNHNCYTYPTPKSGVEHEFYCLKGEPTFETIRFSFIDPQSRIRTQKQVDSLKNVSKHITSIKIQDTDKLTDQEIIFSPNLNVVIGGASSGKSLLFNLLGEKVENPKNNFEKYNIDTSNVLIKTSNSHTFQSSDIFNKNEIIYINQGDIVSYFEEGNLKSLINDDSNKKSELDECIERLKTAKNELLTQIESFGSSFDNINEIFRSNLTINEIDFENMLSDKFHFIEARPQFENLNYTEKIEFLSELINDTEKLKGDDIYNFTEAENRLIDEFRELLASKNRYLKKELKIKTTIESFIANINLAIDEKNNSMDSTARAKNEAFKRKGELISACSDIFIKSKIFFRESILLESYRYDKKEEISVDENVSLILEVENLLDIKEGLLRTLNDSDNSKSTYENFLILLKDNSKLKEYSIYTKEHLIRKIKRELKEALDSFDSPVTFLDYGENGNSKDKSPGFNSEMFLKTILQSQDCKLIMIDQPEDNLGNIFKNETLIDYLRQYKFQKQIIIVTHNPSIVVYGDAENIILAKNENETISYEQLVLERKDDQKKIIDNLDGGKVIFNMRSRKYNIKKLLNS